MPGDKIAELRASIERQIADFTTTINDLCAQRGNLRSALAALSGGPKRRQSPFNPHRPAKVAMAERVVALLREHGPLTYLQIRAALDMVQSESMARHHIWLACRIFGVKSNRSGFRGTTTYSLPEEVADAHE